MTILIDANIFCAYANERDVHHKKAVQLLQDIFSKKYGDVITTDYIFDETISVTLRKSTKKEALELGNFLLHSEIFVAKIDTLLFEKAWMLFKEIESFNFTDCSTLAFMDIFSVKHIATFDKAFKKIDWVIVVD
ncbi:type II toxin-antitoxin system VapC family toxin [Candidatus Woesearchaeota archaeon]|nr:type II toxin-antitoxin system VapC family toxin [Candidatus Woesearchaeota archaeon]